MINDLVSDQRVDRSCRTLTECGFEVTLVGRKKRNSPELDTRTYRTFRFRMLFEKNFLFYAFFNIRLFFYLLFKKTDLLFANDLDTLLPNFLVSKIKRKPLIYDSHEFFTEVPELVNRPLVQKTWKKIEQFIFPKLNDIITVNHSIAQLYSDLYSKKLVVVRNIPAIPAPQRVDYQEISGLPADKPMIILQGAGINIDRGAEEALESMQYIDNAVLLIIGDGDVIPLLKEKASMDIYKNRVIFLPRQPYNKLAQFTRRAHLGLTLDKDTNINYRYSLPNKIFDYIHAGIPVLASPLPEIKNIFNQFNIGCTIESHDPMHIAEKIKFMLYSTENREIWKKNLIIASEKLNWVLESEKLKDVIRKYA